MTIISPEFGNRPRSPASAAQPDRDASRRADLARQWAALHQAAIAIAQLAGPAARVEPGFAAMPEAMLTLTGWRRVMAEQGVADLVAIMEPGLTALVGAHARGADTTAAAQALWQEFAGARAGLLALAPLAADDGGAPQV